MILFRYDETFDGLLSAVFDAYSLKLFPDQLIGSEAIAPLFIETIHPVTTESTKAARVWNGLQKRLPEEALGMLTYVWQSEADDSDWLLFRYLRRAFDHSHSIVFDFADPVVLEVKQLAKKVSRERHYLMQFVRFQKTGDGLYFAPVAPVYNVLPLITEHFRDRFSDQRWALYDEKRRYGYYYDLYDIKEIFLNEDHTITNGRIKQALLAQDEALFQQLWQNYFQALTIEERLNLKLHRRNMPTRFWKYLTEKQLQSCP